MLIRRKFCKYSAGWWKMQGSWTKLGSWDQTIRALSRAGKFLQLACFFLSQGNYSRSTKAYQDSVNTYRALWVLWRANLFMTLLALSVSLPRRICRSWNHWSRGSERSESVVRWLPSSYLHVIVLSRRDSVRLSPLLRCPSPEGFRLQNYGGNAWCRLWRDLKMQEQHRGCCRPSRRQSRCYMNATISSTSENYNQW